MRFGVPDSRPAARSRGLVFDREDDVKETVMAYVSAIGAGACEARVDALRAEFGAVLAARILDAEELDFLWDGRISERYLGQQFGSECDDGSELSRIAIVSFLDGSWHAAVCLADGDGDARALLWKQRCADRAEALAAYGRAV
jgi:hypothetical protein